MPNPPPPATTPTIVYFDGWCDACIKSANFFTKIDNNRGILTCIDFRSTNPDLTPLINQAGVDSTTLATSLHTRTPDGALHAGPEAIRQAFNQLGKNHAAAWTAWPIIKPIVNLSYRIFARNRLRWFANHRCQEGTCKVNQL